VNGPLSDDGSQMIMNPSLAAVRGTKNVAKRGSGKLGDFQINTSLRSVLGSGGASITSGAAGARRGSGQLMAPPLQSGSGTVNGNNMMNGMNGSGNNNEKSPNPSNNNSMRPPSQQHMRRFSAAATAMSLSASPSLPTLGADGNPSTRNPSHARSQSRSASPQPQPLQSQTFSGESSRVPITLNHSTSVKQFGHAHSLSLSVHGATSPSQTSQTISNITTGQTGNRLLAARAPPREGRRRTADRGEVKTVTSSTTFDTHVDLHLLLIHISVIWYGMV
jgi:hypothetical protein